MTLSHMLHAWELLKKGGWFGILVGLAFGLERQEFHWPSALYSISHWEGKVTIQGARFIYWIADIRKSPNLTEQHELNLVPLVLWALAGCGLAVIVAESFGHHRGTPGTSTPTKARAEVESARMKPLPDRGDEGKNASHNSDTRA